MFTMFSKYNENSALVTRSIKKKSMQVLTIYILPTKKTCDNGSNNDNKMIGFYYYDEKAIRFSLLKLIIVRNPRFITIYRQRCCYSSPVNLTKFLPGQFTFTEILSSTKARKIGGVVFNVYNLVHPFHRI